MRGYSREKDPLAIATEKLTKCLEWRAANNVDRALLSEPANMDEFLSVWPCVLHGQDRDGHPIYYEHIGKVEMDKLQEKFDLGAHFLFSPFFFFHSHLCVHVLTVCAGLFFFAHRRLCG